MIAILESTRIKNLSIPIIINSSEDNDSFSFLKQRVKKEPPENILLLKKINYLFETEKQKILLAIDDDNLSYAVSVYLTQNNYDIYLAKNTKDILKKSYGVVPDMVILDSSQDNINVAEILESLESHHLTKDIATIYISDMCEKDTAKLSNFKAEVIDRNQGIEYIVSRINQYFTKFKEEIEE